MGGGAAVLKALVTGGGGFLGSAVVRRLLDRGDEVRTLARGDYPALREAGVDVRRGDLADYPVVREAVAGCDVVFHVAARAGDSGPFEDYYRANVVGTASVIEACRRAAVPRLVQTSTPSVVHTGRGIAGGTETLPYARRYRSPYPATKAAAERLVLAANDDDLATVALRPRLIWGPGDTQLVPRVLDRARRGQLRLVGDGSNRLDTTFIDDAADAHLNAADRLAPGAAPAGRAYFVSSGDPQPLRVLVDGILAAAGLPPVTSSIPFRVAFAVGAVAETVGRLTGSRSEPLMTRFQAEQLAAEAWFDISAARRDLGYAPRHTVATGLAELERSLRVGR